MAHGVIVESAVSDAHEDARAVHEGCRAFDHMEAGLQYCEERFLEVLIHCWAAGEALMQPLTSCCCCESMMQAAAVGVGLL